MDLKFLPPIILLTTISFYSSAQKVLKGMVVDSVSLNAVPGVNVRNKTTNRGTITDANGMFTLKVKETDTLVFSSVGYVRVELPVSFDDEVMFVRMVQEVVMLREVEVRARVGAYENKESPSLKLNRLSSPFAPSSNMLHGRGLGAKVNVAYFSHQEAEKRKLEKSKAVLTGTQTYVDIVTDPEVIQELEHRFLLSDSAFYKILTLYSVQHQDMVHSSNSGDILNSLLYFFEFETQRYRLRH